MMGWESPQSLPGFLRKMPGLWQFPPKWLPVFGWSSDRREVDHYHRLSRRHAISEITVLRELLPEAFFGEHQTADTRLRGSHTYTLFPRTSKALDASILGLLQYSVWITTGYTPSFSRPRAWRWAGGFIHFIVILFHFLVTSWWEPGVVTCIYNPRAG